MKNLKIVTLSRQKIVYKYPKKENRRESISIVASFLFILFCACIFRVQNTSVSDSVFDTVAQTVNPSTPLYKEMTEIIFTNANGELAFTVPVASFKDGKVAWNL